MKGEGEGSDCLSEVGYAGIVMSIGHLYLKLHSFRCGLVKWG